MLKYVGLQREDGDDKNGDDTYNGSYLYTEAAGSTTGDLAIIESPSIPALGSGGACVTFWYHMLGSTMGSLIVYSPENTEYWKKTGNQGNLWMQANVWLQASTRSSQMFIRGELGGPHYSDIAIDDITIQGGVVCQNALPGANDCDFEEGLCTWSPGSDNTFPWIRTTGATGSQGTGPGTDHTKGDDTGYYLYIEASGVAEGSTAQLISDTITNSDNGYCAEFWFHMYGLVTLGMGSLTVYQKLDGSDDPQVAIWREDQPRGPQWNQAQLDFTGKDPYHLIFEAVRGSSFMGDIAIDDIAFHDGKCPTPSRCDFENGDCSYTPGTGSDFNWNVIQPNSGGTAPPIDITYRTAAGHVLFADLSSLTSNNQQGIVDTGYLDSTDAKGRCFQFWYYMGTSGVSVLKVYMETEGGQRTKLWEMDAVSHADEWHVQETNLISTTSRMKVSFEASTTNYQKDGGIALDEIILADFPCSPFGSCDFENAYCTWKNEEKDDDTDWQLIQGVAPSSTTGPDADHTYGTVDGVYIYMASTYLKEGDTAILKSTAFTADTNRCFGFWYFMEGWGIGNLITQISAEGLTEPLTLRTIQDDQGSGWKQALVPIQSLTNAFSYEIILKGVRGTTSRGDISIDDVTLEDKDCSSEAAPVTHDCDFESDLCYWVQDEEDDFDWLRASGLTDSAGTGPGADHTYGTERGFYIYTEASGLAPGNTVRLVSNLLINPTVEGSCMEFWYQMYGEHLGSLNVYQKIDDSETALWRETEPRGPQWNPARVQLSGTAQYLVILEGVRGSNYQGDIALDDITFTSGDCGTPILIECVTKRRRSTAMFSKQETPSASRYGAFIGTQNTGPTQRSLTQTGYCGFENGQCGLTQAPTDALPWQLSRAFPASEFLPPFDATYKTPLGYFMFLDLSNVQNVNDLGKLESGVFPGGSPSVDRCLNVWFYLINSTAISLTFKQESATSTNTINLGSITGQDLTTEWHVIQEDITVTEDFKITFQVQSLDITQKGSVSIDDFKLTDGPCPWPGSCDFENGFCMWKNEENLDDFDWQLIQGRTPSDDTGPPNDHTKMTSYGIYAYMETTGRRAGDIAIVKSTEFASGYIQCLEFYYYMYGEDLGRLDVQSLQDKDAIGTTLRSYSGNQGEAWRQSLVTLDIVDGSLYTVLLNASVGAAGYCDIAVDDIMFYPGNCSGRSDICDFSVDFCDWSQADDDDTNWKLGSGSDSRYGNDKGLRDHSIGLVGGAYAYIDVRSSQNKPGDRARLLGLERVPPTYGQAECLGFWYHLDEADVGSLNITMKWVDNGTLMMSDSLWSISGNRDDQWWFGAATIVSKFPYQAIFEGTIGTGTKGGITIDDVGFTSGSCDPPGHCSFDENMCSWQSTADDGDNDELTWIRETGSTVSGNTGPTNDHTKGTSEGYYMHVDATNTNAGDTATLFSEVFDPSSDDGDCFAFWYHMRGSGRCDFENGDCSYTPGTGSDFNWNVIQPNSGGTAPPIDITYRTAAGHVLFADLSSLTSNTQKGIVDTGYMDSTDSKGRCFQFWYYMGTSGVSVLKVYMETEGGQRTKLWEMDAVSFEASTTNYQKDGGIALDEIVLADFPCSPFGSCDFENAYCTWKNEEKDDDTDWQLIQGVAPSSTTGPDADHTYGTVDGVYIYMASTYLTEGDTAILKSTAFTADTNRCFGFWYFMEGWGIGNLITQITAEGFTEPLTLRTIQDDQGSGWKQALVPIQSLTNAFSYEILLKGVRGTTSRGDISIDDVTLEDKDCSSEAAPVTHNCDFESDLCYWVQDEQDDFDWLRASGLTDSAGTGPGADHTYGTERGFYIYTEASGLAPGNTVRLVSNLLINPTVEGSCMEFWYQMYGEHLGSLNVYQKIDDSETALWRETEPRGPQWNPARVQLSGTAQFIVILEGVRGSDYQGDIALDDITFTSGDCGTPSYCGFENGQCGFTQAPTDALPWQLSRAFPASEFLPPFDATYKTPLGYFMFLDLSNVQNVNDLGKLESGVFPRGTPSVDRCLNVWFYLINSTAISLTFKQESATSTNTINLGSITGQDLTTEWHVIQEDITVTEDFKITFQVQSLDITQQGSVSIDDFKVTDGPCPWPGSCDFENGFCMWKNEENLDDFDWQLIQGRTPSDETGPPNDHTKMTSYGIYAYMETTGRRSGDIAILKSTEFASGYIQCLEFYYYMYGEDLGRLDVQSLQDKDAIGTTLRSYSGNQGEAWRQSLVTLDIVDGSLYTVLLNASVGAAGYCDIAVDDIMFYPGNCSGRSDICDFSVDFCDWSQADDDDTNWKLGSGSDSRYGNDEGLRDHSIGLVGGAYAYIDVRSSQNKPGDRARLLSLERVPPTYGQAECLGFWYHLDEADVGSLNVTMKWVDNGTLMMSDSLWSISGNRDDQWWFGAATVVSKFPYQAIIEGTIGTGTKGGITIDDVGFTSGSCDPPGHCSFDQNMCSWQSTGDDGDSDELPWIRETGSTVSGNTGPTNDHTKGTSEGYYMHVDATNTNAGDTATLFSEVFDPSSEDGDCFAFWYHMRGSGNVTLSVFYQQFNPPTNYDPKKMFAVSGTQGNLWREYQFDITSGQEFQILFRVLFSENGYIDVAIDDTSLTTTKCSDFNQWHCPFEDGLCGYTQATDEERNWVRRGGSTSSTKTGPDADHTLGSGYYLYLETSGGSKGDKARLLSPFAPPGKYCVGFWFHMFGQTIATLNVYIQRNETALDLPVWTRTGSSGNQWIEGYVDVVDIYEFRVVYEAIRGDSYTGDIAIDDLDMVEGQCSGTHACDFQHDDLCGYQQETVKDDFDWLQGSSSTVTFGTGPTVDHTYKTPYGTHACDFQHDDLCGYSQETVKDDFDWLQGSSSTVTFGTGPTVDHTYKTPYGKYMYIDSSKQSPGDKAQFYSPKLDADPSGFACWTFYYNMYGAGIDTLRILVRMRVFPAR
eukprot:XP_011672475.1 PREDICTED: MAM and LDL-receptor class A domain-containing protein 2-like [Strongylocentrotus purpuratus]